MSKPVWVLIVVLLPVLGGILWLAIGRSRRASRLVARAPDDDPEFLGRIGTISDQDERIRRLEEELAQLDAEDDDPKWSTPPNPAPGAAARTRRTRRRAARPPRRRRRRQPRSARGRRLTVTDEAPRLAAPLPTDAAAALLCRLVELGVDHIVLSPGSRSQALALVAAEFERRGSIRLHVRIDERVAGFTALGIGRETRMPAPSSARRAPRSRTCCPAALEAHHAGVPLLLLTADRPPELRGVGANQTTRQPGHVRAERAARGRSAGARGDGRPTATASRA